MFSVSTYNKLTVPTLSLTVQVVMLSLGDDALQVLLTRGASDRWQQPGCEVTDAELLELVAGVKARRLFP